MRVAKAKTSTVGALPPPVSEEFRAWSGGNSSGSGPRKKPRDELPAPAFAGSAVSCAGAPAGATIGAKVAGAFVGALA
jgi:hypothetical protein